MNISYPLIRTRTFLRNVHFKKCSFFGKFGLLCFLETLVLELAILPYYRRPIVKESYLCFNINVLIFQTEYIHSWKVYESEWYISDVSQKEELQVEHLQSLVSFHDENFNVAHLTQYFIWQMLQVSSLASQYLLPWSFESQSLSLTVFLECIVHQCLWKSSKISEFRKISNVIALLDKISYAQQGSCPSKEKTQ